MIVRVHIIASGLVQGVGFRYFIFNKAKDLNLSGHVKNLFSGDVEIEAEGERSLIEEFIGEIKVGPRFAKINDLKIDWIKCSETNNLFEIR